MRKTDSRELVHDRWVGVLAPPEEDLPYVVDFRLALGFRE